MQGSNSARILYALTPSGVVYVLKLENTSAYKSGSVFPLDQLIHLEVRPHLNETNVTSVAASPGFLFLGRSDGCVSCFQPAVSPQTPSGGLTLPYLSIFSLVLLSFAFVSHQVSTRNCVMIQDLVVFGVL